MPPAPSSAPLFMVLQACYLRGTLSLLKVTAEQWIGWFLMFFFFFFQDYLTIQNGVVRAFLQRTREMRETSMNKQMVWKLTAFTYS